MSEPIIIGTRPTPAPAADPTGPLGTRFSGLQMPTIGAPAGTPPVRVDYLEPGHVREAIGNWFDTLPGTMARSRILEGGSSVSDRSVSLSPTGFEFVSRDVAFRAGADPGIRASGYVVADWTENYERLRDNHPVIGLLGIEPGVRAPQQGVVAQGSVWSPNFFATIAMQNTDTIAGGVSAREYGSVMGSYSAGSWQTVGEFQTGSNSPFGGAFALSPDRQQMRIGLYDSPVTGGREQLGGVEFYRGAGNPGGVVSGWIGPENAQLAFLYDLPSERVYVLGRVEPVQIPVSGATATFGGNFDSRQRTVGVDLNINSPDTNRVQGNGAVDFRFRPSAPGSAPVWEINLGAAFRY